MNWRFCFLTGELKHKKANRVNERNPPVQQRHLTVLRLETTDTELMFGVYLKKTLMCTDKRRFPPTLINKMKSLSA